MYIIRRATLDDVEAIRSIAEKAWLTGHFNSRERQYALLTLEQVYSAEEIRILLEGKVQFFLLIEDTLQPVGFISWSVEPLAFVIHQTYCLPSTQGKGYVSLLINEVLRIAAEEGKKTVDLKISTPQVNLRYYNNLGFELVPNEFPSTSDNAGVEFLFRQHIY
ncbi:GNAT family N-acetyltransferase [Pedobacter sp. ISL-68]|uniref:GNAT family N-acetyltransferase n=1 Tax=unclassified Pedobacter TaxID=2628915 RepID=UPI001BE9693F|nr:MULTISPECIES: GNAT family N-acetyltransferase [unclassified Pedobacter]MBT2560266.1 GNAT family N-acetyltransferase [Pedobacter sp. ISL-64]MBT2589246.1 GNAT family N-acetyltransferase [Pedobacter sp. ISL-68]